MVRKDTLQIRHKIFYECQHDIGYSASLGTPASCV
jgi:hypothetical protein